MRLSFARTLAAPLLAAVLLPASLAGQTPWLGLRVPTGVSIEMRRPFFEEGEDISALSSAWFGTGRFGTGATRFVVEVPFAYFDFEEAEESSKAIGNIYLGMERWWERTTLELGIRLPTAPDDEFAAFVGILADPDRLNAFYPDVASAGLLLGHELAGGESPLRVRLLAGPTLLVSTDDESLGDDTELLLSYGVQAWYQGRNVETGGGLTGAAVLTEEGDLGERTFHQAGLTVNLLLASVRPGIHLRVPLDDEFGDILDFTLGLHLVVPIGAR